MCLLILYGIEFGFIVIILEIWEGLLFEVDLGFMDSFLMIYKVFVRFYFWWDYYIEGDFILD